MQNIKLHKAEKMNKKYQVEVSDETLSYFKKHIDNSINTETLLSKMLELLKEILKTANGNIN